MKNMNFIASHLLNKPQYIKLKDYRCLNSIKNSLTPSVTRGIKYIYKKNNTAFFVFEHPLFKTEFDYKLKTIKSILKMLQTKKQICKDIQNIKSFVQHNRKNIDKTIPTIATRTERATGSFKNPFVDKELKTIFQNIKDIIIEKQVDKKGVI